MRWTVLAAISCCVGLVGCFNPEGGTEALGDTDEIETTTMPGGVTSASTSGTSGTTTAPPPTTSTTTTTPNPTTGDDETTSGPDDSTDTSDTTSRVECAACVTATPEGWSGPVVVAGGETPPDCSGAFTGVQLDAFVDISAAGAGCSCGCGAANVDCGPVSLLYRQGCGAPVVVVEYAEPDTCHDNTPAQNSTNPFYAPVANTESCPPVETVDLPEVSSSGVRLCGGTFVQHECSAGELCVPAAPDGFDADLCITRMGVHDCPPAYPEQQVVFESIADSRGCSDCECEPTGEFDCTSTLQVHNDDSCTDFRESLDTGECVGSWQSFTFDAPTITGTCSASGGTPMGEVAGAGPRTVCCQ